MTQQEYNFNAKLEYSINLLRKGERLALRYNDFGYFLAFSGGKDSQALYHVAKLAGVKFQAHYSITTIDPPELVRFIKRQYPDVILDRNEYTFASLCIKKKALPTIFKRFCCAELKETKGANTVTLTGVRHAESAKRALRQEAEYLTKNKDKRKRGTFEQIDEFTRNKENEGIQCINGKDKIVINPIINWSDKDVWYFLNNIVKVPHCELYDKGEKRLGCLFCPMASYKTHLKECEEYPKYKAIMLKTINQLRKQNYMSHYKDLTDEEIFDVWISQKSIRKWYAEHKLQLKLFE